MATPAMAPHFQRLATPDRRENISLPEILSALSFALDLTEGAVPGHALRSCLLGMRLARALGFPPDQLADLYYALLLKDVGCSSNAGRLCQIIGGGDEREVKAGVKLEDWTKPSQPKLSTLRLLWKTVLPEAGPLGRAAGIVKIGLTQHRNNEEMIGFAATAARTSFASSGSERYLQKQYAVWTNTGTAAAILSAAREIRFRSKHASWLSRNI